MFRRRRKLTIREKVQNFVWPRAGFKRTGRYWAHRISRLSGTPKSIALGLACGVAVSFTPFIGFHFALAALFAWMMGANLLASALGTAAGNPWTFPFIWYATYKTGAWMLGPLGVSDGIVPEHFTMDLLVQHPLQVFLPMLLGSLPYAVVAFVLTFLIGNRAVGGYQALRRARRKARTQALANAAMKSAIPNIVKKTLNQDHHHHPFEAMDQ